MDQRKVSYVIQRTFLKEMKELQGYDHLQVQNPETQKDIENN